MEYQSANPMEHKEKKVLSEHISDILFFFYILGVTAFKSSIGFDFYFCRATYIVLVAYEVFLLFFDRKKVNTSILKWYVPFIAFYFISMIWGNFNDGMYYFNNFIQILGIIVFYSLHINTRDDVLKYFKILVFSLLISCFMIYSRSSLSDLGTARIGRELTLNSNTLGRRLAYGGIICLFFAQTKKIYYLIFAYLVFYSLFSGSKNAFFILLIGITIFYSFKNKGFKVFINILCGVFILAILLYIAFTIDDLYSVLGRRLEIFWNTFLGESTIINGNIRYDGSLEERSFYIRYALNMFLKSFFWGFGANSFVTEMRNISYWHIAYSHNTYAEILATLGIVGCFLYFTPQAMTLFDQWKKVFKEHNPYNVLCLTIIIDFIFMQWGAVTYMTPIDYIIIIPVLISSLNPNIAEKQIEKNVNEGTACEETAYNT